MFSLIFWSMTMGCGGCRDEAEDAATEFPGDVVFIGVDGLDPSLLRGLLQKEPEEFPNLKRLADEGFLVDLEVSASSIISPILWTSMFTGYDENQHQVGGWTMAGGTPVTQETVQAVRFWEAASQQGRSILQVGSLMTSPVVTLNGVNFGDGFVQAHFSPKDPDLESHVYPASLAKEVDALVPSIQWMESHPIFNYQIEAVGAGVHPLAVDETNVRVFEHFWPSGKAQIGVVYIRGIDRVGHLADPNSETGQQLARMGQGTTFMSRGPRWVGDYYTYADELIGRVLTHIDPTTTTVVLASDHGFEVLKEEAEWESRHRDPGLLMGWGKRARTDVDWSTVNQLDLGVTMFALAGVGPGEDVKGRRLEELFDLEGAPASQGSWTLKGHLPLAGEGRQQSLADEQTEQLKALGYIDQSGQERQDRQQR